MIFDCTKNLALYKSHGVGDRYAKAAAFLTKSDPAGLALGRHEIDGDNVYATVFEYDSVPWEEAAYESHKLYTDIQFVAKGTEIMTFALESELEPSDAYNAEKDVQHFSNSNPGARVTVKAGEYMIFKPGEGHKSKGMVGKPSPMKKVVVKIKES